MPAPLQLQRNRNQRVNIPQRPDIRQNNTQRFFPRPIRGKPKTLPVRLKLTNSLGAPSIRSLTANGWETTNPDPPALNKPTRWGAPGSPRLVWLTWDIYSLLFSSSPPPSAGCPRSLAFGDLGVHTLKHTRT
jgi:hypothetical protein